MDKRLTWDKSYVLPHESIWGQREKFCLLNALMYQDCKNKYRKCLFLPSINYSTRFMYSHVRYCPECSKHGYHSYLHQLIFFDTCYIHKSAKLIDTDIPYHDMWKSFGKEDLDYFPFSKNLRASDILDIKNFKNKIEHVVDKMSQYNSVKWISDIDNSHQSTINESTKKLVYKVISGTVIKDIPIISIEKNKCSLANEDVCDRIIRQNYEYYQKYGSELGFDVEITYLEFLQRFQRKDTSGKVKWIFHDLSAIMVQNLIYETINLCGGVREYYKYFDEVKKTELTDFNHQNIAIIARILTICSITMNLFPEYFIRLGIGWSKAYEGTALKIFNKVSGLGDDFPLLDEKTQKCEMFIFPIITQVFNSLTIQFTKELKKIFKDTQDVLLLNCQYLLRIPQYVLVESKGRYELFQCE